MNKYGINIIWSDEDNEFVATCPDFPGLSAFGETVEEALKEAKIALGLFLESHKDAGESLPTPTVRHKYSGQLRLRLAKSLHESLAESAKQEGLSLNSYINQLIVWAHSSKNLLDQIMPDLRQSGEKASEATGLYTKRPLPQSRHKSESAEKGKRSAKRKKR